jgi:hypothetical protein
MNEPADPEHTRLQVWYKDVEQAIRKVDPDHILFLDGNSYSMDFSAFEEVLPNCVYSIHDYSNMGFPAGQPYEGTEEQIDTLKRQYERKVAFMRERKVPVSIVPIAKAQKSTLIQGRSGTANSVLCMRVPMKKATSGSTNSVIICSASNFRSTRKTRSTGAFGCTKILASKAWCTQIQIRRTCDC